jgi:4-amino-4-deoxy-L-arabinose transferase-like glycosyltransferase
MTVAERANLEVATGSQRSSVRMAWDSSLAPILVLIAALIAAWALYFTITEAPLAIKHDMSEAYAWGHEFQLGYNQHPPFWAWICGLWFSVFPRTGWAFALLSSANAGIGLLGAWMLIGDFAEGRKRMAAWALLLLTPLYTFYAYKYNANIIFLSIWPWTLHYSVRSLQSRSTRDAILLGLLIGLALLSKYYALILVATCFLGAIQHPMRRRYFASASPYLSAVVTAVVCAPHVWWLLTNRAPPLRYLDAISDQNWPYVLAHVGDTLWGVVAMNVGVVVVVGWVTWRSRRDGVTAFAGGVRGAPFRVLATLALAPLVLTVASALVLRNTITPEMTIGIFPLLLLVTIEVFGVRDIDRLHRIATLLAAAVTLGALVLSPAIALARTWLSSNAMNVAPFQEIATEATRIWHDRTSLPLAYVAGSNWYENATTFYSPDRPHTFVHFDYTQNLWVTPEALVKHGLLSICLSGDSVCLAATARFSTPETTQTELSVARVFWGHAAKPVKFVVTVIPPR